MRIEMKSGYWYWSAGSSRLVPRRHHFHSVTCIKVTGQQQAHLTQMRRPSPLERTTGLCDIGSVTPDRTLCVSPIIAAMCKERAWTDPGRRIDDRSDDRGRRTSARPDRRNSWHRS